MRMRNVFVGMMLSVGLLSAESFAEGGTMGSAMKMDGFASAQFQFIGPMGDRIQANLEHWLLRAPGANPSLLEMFYRRDRHLPYPTPVPWAGEFAGKYLISAAQALRMTDDARLRTLLDSFIAGLIAAQDADGYLGPWPKHERLLTHWDLWGHYHIILGLLLWHDVTGDPDALACARRIADCVCAVYPEGGRRPIEAGTPAMNLAMLHAMALIHRRTGAPEHLAMARRFEEDLSKDGDWLEKGAAGVLYHQLPGSGPRWESLHIVQGLVELFQISGESRYRDAAVNLWNSIRKNDRHPSGAFSTHEQAFGSIHANGSIETCCTVAWMALSVDVLRLTGDPTIADELERSTWNQCLAAQHPSGSWCTYDTPMNGVRAPSYHQINFQYRPGSPELNCCSVNAPRGLGMLSDWAVLRDGNAIILNYYGPSACSMVCDNGAHLKIRQETHYPVDGLVKIVLEPDAPIAFPLRLRIPEWANHAEVRVNDSPETASPQAASYFTLERTWTSGDTVTLILDMPIHTMTGAPPDRFGKVALLRGPLLLAFDAFFNVYEASQIPEIAIEQLTLKLVQPGYSAHVGRFAPIGLWRAMAADGTEIMLCDFASAGAHGTEYAAWLPAAKPLPVPVALSLPEDGAEGAPGALLFRWDAYAHPDITYRLCIARDADFTDIAAQRKGLNHPFVIVDDSLQEAGEYYWKVVAENAHGSVDNAGGARRFRVNPAATQAFTAGIRDDGVMIDAPMHGDAAPVFGVLDEARNVTPAENHAGAANAALRFTDGMARYRLPFFPESDYTAAAWIRPEALGTPGLQQVFSAWRRASDDPLRITIEGGAVHARIESPAGFFSTADVPLREGEWTHVAAVKQGRQLTLYVNGAAGAPVAVPEKLSSSSLEAAFGANPRYPGGEYFRGCISNAVFFARTISPDELQKYATK